jgi:hypothetical protein
MRVRIRAPFDSEIISPKTIRRSNKIDNVKAKIDNVKAKIQDEEKEPWSRPTLARASPTSFPLEESLRLARQVSASHDKSSPDWCVDSDALPPAHVEERISTSCKIQQLAAMQAARPAKSLNASLTSRAAITSPSSPTLPYASSARGTQAPSTTRTSLDLGSGVAS